MDGTVGDQDPSGAEDREIAVRSRSRRWIVVAVVAAAAVLIVGIAATIAVSRPDPGYDDATKQRFVTACVADGGDVVTPACECLYTAITEQIPYGRFAEVDKELTAQHAAGQAIALPDDIAALGSGLSDPGLTATTAHGAPRLGVTAWP